MSMQKPHLPHTTLTSIASSHIEQSFLEILIATPSIARIIWIAALHLRLELAVPYNAVTTVSLVKMALGILVLRPSSVIT